MSKSVDSKLEILLKMLREATVSTNVVPPFIVGPMVLRRRAFPVRLSVKDRKKKKNQNSV